MHLTYVLKLALVFVLVLIATFLSVTFLNWEKNPEIYDLSLIPTILPTDWFHYIGYSCTLKKEVQKVYFGNPNYYNTCHKLNYPSFTSTRIQQLLLCFEGSYKHHTPLQEICSGNIKNI